MHAGLPPQTLTPSFLLALGPLCVSSPPNSQVSYPDGTILPPSTQAKYLGVILTPTGSTRQDITQRLARARKQFQALTSFWRHTALSTQWKLRMYNATFIPYLTYAAESASITPQDLNRLEAFRSHSLCKIANLPSTYYTKVVAPHTTTYTNQDERHKTQQPTMAEHIHSKQLKFFGHILRSDPCELERNCCFTSFFVYRGGFPGEKLREAGLELTGLSRWLRSPGLDWLN